MTKTVTLRAFCHRGLRRSIGTTPQAPGKIQLFFYVSQFPSPSQFRIAQRLQVLGQDGCPDDSLLWDLTQCDQQTLQWLQQLLLCLLHGGSRLGRLGVEVDINFGSFENRTLGYQ